MQRVFLDVETHWSDDYSLTRMTPVEYILDPRFEALGCAFIHEGSQGEWIDGPDLARYLAGIDWPNTYAVAHNSSFDMAVLAFRYGVVPGFYGDTLSMARNWLSHQLSSVSLASVAEYYGMPAKMETVAKTKGLTFQMLREMPALYAEVKDYALDDAAKCREIFGHILMDGFPPRELEIVDWVTRMVTQPQFELDRTVLAEHLADEKARKQALLDDASLNDDDLKSLRSDRQLAAQLLYFGVNPLPMKVSKTTGQKIYAFAKTDQAFTTLLDHEEPRVRALTAARLGHKSTLEETRAQRLLAIAGVTPSMPVPLKYSGAHTHRFSGDWSINLQNLPRGSELRRALRAPKGKLVVAIDASQIEARLNATLSGQLDLVEAFRNGEDVYASFAEGIYLHPVTKKTHPKERFVGKTGILSLGYGSSAPVFQNMCRVEGDVHLTNSQAASIVSLYRRRFRKIVGNWRIAEREVIPAIARGGNVSWGPLVTRQDALLLPNGNCLHYRNLRRALSRGKSHWQFMRGDKKQKIYGAKLVENVIQALAFLHITETAMRVKHLTQGLLLPAHQVHDELVFVVDEHLAEQVRDLVILEMSKSPEWMPGVPLAAEGRIAETY